MAYKDLQKLGWLIRLNMGDDSRKEKLIKPEVPKSGTGVLTTPDSKKPEVSKDKMSIYGQTAVRSFRSEADELTKRLGPASPASSLESGFYKLFYSTTPGRPRYNEGTPEFEKYSKEYEQDVIDTDNDLKVLSEAKKKEGKIAGGYVGNDGWAHYNGGYISSAMGEDTGRIYMNVDPEKLPGLYEQLIKRMTDAGVVFDSKIPSRGNTHTLTRPDKLVVYFPSAEEEKLLKVVEAFHRDNASSFMGIIPPFSARVAESQSGLTLNGVGFGQEPSAESQEILKSENKSARHSFGTLHCRILAEVVKVAQSEGKQVKDPTFDFDTAFKNSCSKYKVDPENPAFNTNNPNLFKKIREMNKVAQI